MAIANVQLGTGSTDITVAGAGQTRAVLGIVFCNTTTTTKTISMYVIPSGGSANAGTLVLSSQEIPANDSYIWTADEKFILDAGDKIAGLASVGSSVTATVTYYNL